MFSSLLFENFPSPWVKTQKKNGMSDLEVLSWLKYQRGLTLLLVMNHSRPTSHDLHKASAFQQ